MRVWRSFRFSTRSICRAQSRNGVGRRFTFAPYGNFSSAKLGQNSLDNPGDSSGTSFQLGASLNAAIVPDTAHLFIEAGYQSLEQPTALPWANDVASFGGQPASLATQVPAIGIGTYQTVQKRVDFLMEKARTWEATWETSMASGSKTASAGGTSLSEMAAARLNPDRPRSAFRRPD